MRNEEIKVLDLFSGKGAFVSSMRELGLNVKVVGFSEILPYAVEVYKNLHNVDDNVYLGDVRDVINKDIEPFDVLLSGSPCQDFSSEGKRKGGEKGSETRSSLLWEQVKIAEKFKPKYIIWENVKGLTFKTQKHILETYIEDLDGIGYNTCYKLLNSYHYNSVQKRERVFIISIRKDIDDGYFEFPTPIENTVKLIDILEPFIDSLEIDERAYSEMVIEKVEKNIYKIKNGTKLGYLVAEEGDGVDFGFLVSKTRRGRVQKASSQTVQTIKQIGTIQDDKLRYLSPLEYWRIQNFKDEDFFLAKSLGCTDLQLYALAGNSIDLKVAKQLLEKIFKL